MVPFVEQSTSIERLRAIAVKRYSADARASREWRRILWNGGTGASLREASALHSKAASMAIDAIFQECAAVSGHEWKPAIYAVYQPIEPPRLQCRWCSLAVFHSWQIGKAGAPAVVA